MWKTFAEIDFDGSNKGEGNGITGTWHTEYIRVLHPSSW